MKIVDRWCASLWRVPILLGVLTVIGLLSALIGDGPWDALSWFSLSAPTLLGAWLALRRRRRSV